MPTIAPPLSRFAAASMLLTLILLGGRMGYAESAAAPAAEAGSTSDGVTQSHVSQKIDNATGESVDKVDQAIGEADYLAMRDDDVWLISTRHLGCLTGKGEAAFDVDVSRYTHEGDWAATGLDELLAAEPRMTVIYVHGNRVSYDDAITRAWDAFRALQDDPTAPPMRLIIWSWPSDQIRGQIRDVRAKGARTNTEAHYLSWFLSQLDPDISLSLIGFSYGARVVTGAMHVLGGGTLACHDMAAPFTAAGRRPIQVVLIAAAVHSHWLAYDGFHAAFWQCADRLLVLYNSCDPILKRYRFIEKRSRPVAMGYSGTWGLEDDLAARTEERDVCCSVGKTHSESVFFSSEEVIQGVRQHVLTP